MWIKTADLVGVRTLLVSLKYGHLDSSTSNVLVIPFHRQDFHHRYDHLWHASTLDLKDGYPMLRLFDKDDNTIEVEGLRKFILLCSYFVC